MVWGFDDDNDDTSFFFFLFFSLFLKGKITQTYLVVAVMRTFQLCYSHLSLLYQYIEIKYWLEQRTKNTGPGFLPNQLQIKISKIMLSHQHSLKFGNMWRNVSCIIFYIRMNIEKNIDTLAEYNYPYIWREKIWHARTSVVVIQVMYTLVSGYSPTIRYIVHRPILAYG